MKAISLALAATVTAFMVGEATAQQRYILRPAPYAVPRPLPQPVIVPRYQFGFPQPAPHYVIPGQTAGATCYMISNGICYHY